MFYSGSVLAVDVSCRASGESAHGHIFYSLVSSIFHIPRDSVCVELTCALNCKGVRIFIAVIVVDADRCLAEP